MPTQSSIKEAKTCEILKNWNES